MVKVSTMLICSVAHPFTPLSTTFPALSIQKRLSDRGAPLKQTLPEMHSLIVEASGLGRHAQDAIVDGERLARFMTPILIYRTSHCFLQLC